MKITKLLTAVFAALLFTTTSCRNDDEPTVETPKGAYADGILVANEGLVSQPVASIEFLSKDLSQQEENIYSKNNGNEKLGNILQSIGLKDDYAYLVMNVPNKVEIVNRYTFKKTATITAELDNPRYIAFAANQTYITNHDFFSTRKVNIYDNTNKFVKSINFDRFAEKIVSSDNFVYVQTDGTSWNTGSPVPTGHTVSRINPATNTVDKTVTLPDNLAVTDLVADSKFVYVLTADYTTSNLYKITANTGAFETISLPVGSSAQRLSIDQGKLYYLTSDNKVGQINGNSATELFSVTANYAYGFNVIDGLVYVSDPTFISDTTSRIYNLSGTLVKTITTGLGTNGFYKN